MDYQKFNELEQLKMAFGTQLNHANAVIDWMESSKFWRLRLKWLHFRRKLKSVLGKTTIEVDQAPVPPESFVSLNLDQPGLTEQYLLWRLNNKPRAADLQKLAETIDVFPCKPLISVVMPVFNTPETFLRQAIDSVIQQIYPYWELCIADDASTDSHVRKILEQYQAQDNRIKVVFRDTNGHICHCSNSALELAQGEFIALLDHDDLLTPDALYEVALLINRQPHVDMIYTDEDKIDTKGDLRDAFFKPDWCPDSFLSRMYTCHLGVYRRSLVNQIGGFRVGFEGSQDYDFVLRLTEKTEQIAHIPKILYHWRIHDRSTAQNINNKSYAIDAGKKALEEALERRNEPGKVVPVEGLPGHYLTRYQIADFKRVTIIIPTRDLGEILNRCLMSIFTKTTYPNYEVLVIDNGSVELETFAVFEKWQHQKPDRFHYKQLDVPFNYSKLNNYAVKQSGGDYLLFLNNDTEIITSDWLTAMVEQVQRPSIGAVGGKLLYSDDTVQHAGVVGGLGGIAGHGHKFHRSTDSGYFGQIQTINNYTAVTAACLMCRRDVFELVGGFEEDLAVAFNDVDFCFKIFRKGYRNVCLPHVVLYHHESKSRGYEDSPEKQARFRKEILYMQDKWGDLIEKDSCYSPHLTKVLHGYSIRV